MKLRSKFLLFSLLLTAVAGHAHCELTIELFDKTFRAGDRVELTWKTLIEHNQLDWDLFFTSDDGDTWEVIEENLPVQTLQYVWEVPDVQSAEVRIRIVQDNQGMDYDDVSDLFAIGEMTTATDEALDIRPFTYKFFPNPVDDLIRIDVQSNVSKPLRIVLVDVRGAEFEEIYRNRIQGQISVTWPASQLPNGLYGIQMTSDGYEEIHKFFVLH